MKFPSFFFLLLFQISTLATSGQGTINPKLIVDLQTVREVRISPDGQTCAYTLRVPGGEFDPPGASWSELYLISAEGGTPKALIARPASASQIQWAPDGKSLYFLATYPENDPTQQVYRIEIRGTEPKQVTHHPQDISEFALSPNGQQVVFTSRQPYTAQQLAERDRGKDWIVAGEGYRYRHLFLFDIPTEKSIGLFEGRLETSSPVWSPDGTMVYFKGAPTPETDDSYMSQKIHVVSAQGRTPSFGEMPAVMAYTRGKLGPLAPSPDHRHLAWLGATDLHDPLAQSLFVAEVALRKPVNLTEGMEASAVSFQWIDDQTILLLCAEGTYSSLYRVNVTSGTREKVYDKGIVFRSFDFHSPSNTLVFPGSSPSHPNELFAGDLGSNNYKRLTHHNPELERIRLSRQESIRWMARDSLEIEGILTYPINYEEGKQYPLLLQIHGGPEGISQQGWNTRAVYPVQWYASKGYFVLEPNYRGSQGRGVAFSKSDQKDLGGKEFQDVLDGIDHLVNLKLVNPEQVGTGGFSYGGYFSAWAATRHSHRFKAAVVGAGITNWVSFTGTTDIVRENSLVHWNLWWYDHMELVWERSPMAHVGTANTPTLVVHGEKDLRVPPGQGQELYNALQLRKIPSSMVTYRRQPHGILEREAQLDYMYRTWRWFQRYVNP